MVLNCSKENDRHHLEHWQWWNSEKLKHAKPHGKTPAIFADTKAHYYSLYPRSWYEYVQKQNQLKVTCRQFSPVIAHNYKESSYPVGSFVWTVENTSDTEEVEVSIMFTWQNGTGSDNDKKGGHLNSEFKDGDSCSGVYMKHLLHHTVQPMHNPEGDPMSFAIAAENSKDAQVTVLPYFDVYNKDHTDTLWKDFSSHGSLANVRKHIAVPTTPCSNTQKIAAGICVKVTIPAKSSKEIVFSLAWDMPIIRYGPDAHYRRYTMYWGNTGKSAHKIASDAIKNCKNWEAAIEDWQKPVVKSKSQPNWYKSALFNELQYVECVYF